MARTKVNYALRNVNGATIYLNSEPTAGKQELAIPNIFEESAAAKWPLGTGLRIDDRFFRYAYFETAAPTLRGATGKTARTRNSVDSYDSSQAAGTVNFIIDGAGAGNPAEDAYSGGYILILTSAALGRLIMRIHGNSVAATASPYNTTIYLEQALPIAVAANTDCDIFPSRYATINASSSYANDMYPTLGVPTMLHTAAYYGWLQTWGPTFITCTGTELGDAAWDRTAVIGGSDGTIIPADESFYSQKSAQIAGYTLACNGAGSEWIMLMLDR